MSPKRWGPKNFTLEFGFKKLEGPKHPFNGPYFHTQDWFLKLGVTSKEGRYHHDTYMHEK